MVDDQPESIETLRAELAGRQNTTTKVVGFGEFQAAVKEFGPNIIILDLAQGPPAEGDAPGVEMFNEIWADKFCPLVIYSAAPELIGDDERLAHPFVKRQQKGAGSEIGVIGCIDNFAPHLTALDEAGNEIARALNKALKDVAPRIFLTIVEANEQKEMLVRSARRRVAASMDLGLTPGDKLRSWEHYLYPPLIKHLLRGDLIRKREVGEPKASDFAVILTPSCDLARSKVESVLVARCTDVGKLLEDLNAKDAKPSKMKGKVRSLLAEGHGQSCLPLAGLPGVFPVMAADFEQLDIIAIDRIGDDRDYIRVASVDHPFRELVAWAYMANAGRPGLPERELDSWVEEISVEIDAAKAKATAAAVAGAVAAAPPSDEVAAEGSGEDVIDASDDGNIGH